jgi:hypothetical protein
MAKIIKEINSRSLPQFPSPIHSSGFLLSLKVTMVIQGGMPTYGDMQQYEHDKHNLSF